MTGYINLYENQNRRRRGGSARVYALRNAPFSGSFFVLKRIRKAGVDSARACLKNAFREMYPKGHAMLHSLQSADCGNDFSNTL